MKHLLEYLGRRADTLGKYDNPTLRDGPYDFSKGECEVDEKDAEVLLRDNPVAFKDHGIVQPKPEKKKVPPVNFGTTKLYDPKTTKPSKPVEK